MSPQPAVQGFLVVHTTVTVSRTAPASLHIAVDPPDAVTEVAGAVGPSA